SNKIALTRNAVAVSVVFATILPVAALILSPGIAIANHLRGIDHHGDQYRLVAKEVERNWRKVTDQPLRLIGSSSPLANGAAFYLSDRPSTLDFLKPQR